MHFSLDVSMKVLFVTTISCVALAFIILYATHLISFYCFVLNLLNDKLEKIKITIMKIITRV